MTRALLLLLAAAVSASSADPTGSIPTDPDSSLAIVLGSIEGTPLGLEEAIDLAMRHSAAAGEADEAVRAASAAARRERGAFDPELFGRIDRTDEEQPTASPFSGADVLRIQQTSVLAGARITLPFGTELSGSLNTRRTESNSAFASLNPQIDTFGKLDVRHPVLDGFGPSSSGRLDAAERAADAAEYQREETRLAIRALVTAGYWDLYAAERDYAVRLLIRDRAAAFLEETRIRASTGLVGPGQVASARLFLAEQEQALIDAEERLAARSDDLAAGIGVRPASPSGRYRPTGSPPTRFSIEEADPLVHRALERNRALLAARLTIESIRALARGAAWESWPRLDLIGSVGGSGLSGTGRDVVFGSDTLRTERSGGFAETWAQVRDRDYPTWSVGLEVTIPIASRAARGERDRLRAEVGRAEQRLLAAQREIEQQVRARHREVVHGARRLDAARIAVEAANEQVRIGWIEFRNGRSTAFELVRLGADLAAAQQRYSDALVRTAKASASLRRLTAEEIPGETSGEEGRR